MNATAAQQRSAADHLAADGFRVLSVAWQALDGTTIDVIAADSRTLVACMVKGTEPGDRIDGLITKGQKNRLRRAAVRWVIAHGVILDELRVDVIVVSPTGLGPAVTHFRAAA